MLPTASTLQCGGHHCENLSAIIFFFFFFNLSSCCSSILRSPRPLHPSVFVESQLSKAWCMLCWNVLVRSPDFLSSPISSLHQLFFFLPSIPVLVYPSFPLHPHPSISCCLSSEAHCLCFAVRANCIDDLLLRLDPSFPKWSIDKYSLFSPSCLAF